MSTKIYQAWRVSQSDYPEFVRDLTAYTTDQVAKYVKEALGHRRKDIPYIVAVLIRSSLKREYEIGSIDCRLKVVPFGRYLYCVPFSDVSLHGFTTAHGEDYCYWNNTDKPDEVSRKDWSKRRRTWDKVFTHWWVAPTHDIIRSKKIEDLLTILGKLFPKIPEMEFWDAYRDAMQKLKRAADRHVRACDV